MRTAVSHVIVKCPRRVQAVSWAEAWVAPVHGDDGDRTMTVLSNDNACPATLGRMPLAEQATARMLSRQRSPVLPNHLPDQLS